MAETASLPVSQGVVLLAQAAPVPAGPSGYTIRPPQPAGTPAPSPAPGVAPAPVPGVAVPGPGVGTEPVVFGGLTQNGAILGGAIMLGLVVVFLLLRGAVRSHLIAQRASLSAAGAASWALFTLLCVVAFTAVFGLIGSFWAVPSFIVPLGGLSVLMLGLFLYLFGAATRVPR